jgi:hypothetical protein
VKEDGRLRPDLTRPRELIEASADFLLSQVEKQEHWQRPVAVAARG